MTTLRMVGIRVEPEDLHRAETIGAIRRALAGVAEGAVVVLGTETALLEVLDMLRGDAEVWPRLSVVPDPRPEP